jgi:hypothetical protein
MALFQERYVPVKSFSNTDGLTERQTDEQTVALVGDRYTDGLLTDK